MALSIDLKTLLLLCQGFRALIEPHLHNRATTRTHTHTPAFTQYNQTHIGSPKTPKHLPTPTRLHHNTHKGSNTTHNPYTNSHHTITHKPYTNSHHTITYNPQFIQHKPTHGFTQNPQPIHGFTQKSPPLVVSGTDKA